MPAIRWRPLIALTVAVAALVGVGGAAAGPLPALSAPPEDAVTRALRAGDLSESQYALQRALAIFDRDAVVRRFGNVARPGPHDATLVLRDLALRLDGLSAAERERAERLFQRPTALRPDDAGSPDASDWFFYETAAIGSSYFGWCTNYCVSWVTTTRDAPPAVDNNGNGFSDYIDTVFEVMDVVWSTEIGMLGYRTPKSDANSSDSIGLGPQLDIYIMDVEGRSGGVLGYCTTDDPNILREESLYQGQDASAYCVLDNDYAFEGSGWLDVLRATAAHEFFHAIQFAYNHYLDDWLMEATATWMEDEVFDDVNDNHGFVDTSQVVWPDVPLDLSTVSGALENAVYGAYTFFQLLTDTYDRVLVRRLLEASDAVPGKLGEHSLIALPKTLADSGIDFASFYNDYAVANWWPPAFYDEGAGWVSENELGQPVQLAAPMPRALVLSSKKRKTPTKAMYLDHLTAGYAAFVPGRGTKARSRLVVGVDLSDAGVGARASVITETRSGRLKAVPIRIKGGVGVVTIRGFGKLSYTALVLTNGSTRTESCGSDTSPPFFACYGVPLDDGMSFLYQARLVG